jgi:hypothetical protein
MTTPPDASRALTCATLLLLFSSTQLEAALLYVDGQITTASCTTYQPATRGCSGGTERAFKTLAGVNPVVLAGDTVMIRAGSYGDRISPAGSGTAGQAILYTRFGSEHVVITGVPAISLDNRAYITVDGVTVRVSGCGGTCYAQIARSHHVTIRNSRMEQSVNQSGWPQGITIRRNSHHNQLLDNVIGNVGFSTTDDIGTVMEIGSHDPTDKSDYNLVQGNTIYHGGHDLVAVAGNYNIIRNNYFHNEEWMSCARSETAGLCGNRLVVIDGPSSNAKYNVIEGNTFAFSGVPPDNDGSAGVSVRTGYTIIRRNLFYENDLAGLNLSTFTYTLNFPSPHDLRFNHIFHNVFFHNAFSALGTTFKPFEAGITLTNFDGPPITDVTIKNNIMWRNRWQQAVSYYRVDPTKQLETSNWREAGDPEFVRDDVTPDPFDPTLLDFRLQQASPAIDAGAFLTRTVAAGSGTQIVVEDAMYFIDGFGMIAGDLVQLEGESVAVRVLFVDYVLHRLTVDRPLTWRAGQGVSLTYTGTAPDLGAFEMSAAGRSPSAPTNVRILR